MNDIAKAMWDISITHLESAIDTDDVNEAICYTGIAEIALQAAQFAVNNPYLVGGAAEAGIPYVQIPDDAVPSGTPGDLPVPGPKTPVPQGPTGGPQVWGGVS